MSCPRRDLPDRGRFVSNYDLCNFSASTEMGGWESTSIRLQLEPPAGAGGWGAVIGSLTALLQRHLSQRSTSGLVAGLQCL